MPSFDGGHYFLTVLVPIRTDILFEDDGLATSAAQRIRAVLAALPTALQSPATEAIGINSPFSRTTRTHLARLFVIDDTIFNGRERDDAIKVGILGPNPLVPLASDQLCTPYLYFGAEFDATTGDDADVDSYLAELWTTMAIEWKSIFHYCVGFDTLVSDARSFAGYIRRCRIETTMPFNDYWTSAPPFPDLTQTLVKWVGGLAAGAVVLFLIDGLISDRWVNAALFWLFVFILAAVVVAYRQIMAHGQKPLPRAPNSDLPSILKALYLHRQFTKLAIETQGANAEALYDAFRLFVADHKPASLDGPTQSPGVIRS